MAYTKIIVIRGRLDKCVSYAANAEKTSLEAVVDYALNREKTERVCYESAINCDRETVYLDMLRTKERWGKEDRIRKGYHVIQSFPPGEVTPEEAHAIGVELAQRLLGERYEVLVTTHLDKAHLHNHVVFSSVSYRDGTMYRDSLKDYYGGDGAGIRGTSDAICRERGLSVIDPALPLASVSRAEWEAKKSGKQTLCDMLRRDIDAALEHAFTYQDFLAQLHRMGYAVKAGPQVKHTALRPPGGQRFLRLDSLGGAYSEAGIRRKLTETRMGGKAKCIVPTPKRYRIRHDGHRRKLSGFQRLYLRYLYLLGGGTKKRRTPPALHREALRLDCYQEQFRYLRRCRIETVQELSMQYDALQAQADALTAERGDLYRCRRRGQAGLDEQIAALTVQLRVLRREMKLCARIERDAVAIGGQLKQAMEAEQQKEQEPQHKQQKTR